MLGMRHALSRLADDPSLRNRLATAGRQRVAEAYSQEGVGEAMEALLQTVTETAGSPQRVRPRVGLRAEAPGDIAS